MISWCLIVLLQTLSSKFLLLSYNNEHCLIQSSGWWRPASVLHLMLRNKVSILHFYKNCLAKDCPVADDYRLLANDTSDHLFLQQETSTWPSRNKKSKRPCICREYSWLVYVTTYGTKSMFHLIFQYVLPRNHQIIMASSAGRAKRS